MIQTKQSLFSYSYCIVNSIVSANVCKRDWEGKGELTRKEMRGREKSIESSGEYPARINDRATC